MHAEHIQPHAHAHHRQGAEAPDQAAGEEARHEHAQHMPLEHQRRAVEGVVALLHGDRRGRHQQVHHAVAQRRRRHRDDEHRLPCDLAQRPPAGRPGAA
jgi:hypothetical protein